MKRHRVGMHRNIFSRLKGFCCSLQQLMEFAERCHVVLCVFFCYVVVSRDQCVVGHRKGDADASSEKTAMDEEAVRTVSAQVDACGPSDAESFILVLQVTVSS